MTEIGHGRPVRALATLAALLLALAACTQPDTYPVSGEPCDPDDPVQDMADCIPPR